MASRLNAWLLRLCLDCITKPWSPIAFLGRWYGRAMDAWIREIFQPDQPVTWADLNPFARARPSEPATLLTPDES